MAAAEAGDLGAAEASLRQALEHAVNIKERDSSYGDTALLLGQVYRRGERYQESDEMTRKAFDYYQNVFGLTDPRTIQAHLAMVLSNPTDSHDDMDVRKGTFELAKSQFGERSWQAVRTGGLALPALSSGERARVISEAQAACSNVLTEGRAQLGLWPPVAEEFAQALLAQGRDEQAAKFLGYQLRRDEELHGKKSQEAALARLNLGEVFLGLGDPRKAEIAFSRALDIIKLKVGPKSPEVRRAQVALARSLAQQKKLVEAAPHLTDALSFLASHQVIERMEILLALLEQKCLIAGTDSERGALWQELEAIWDRSGDEEVRGKILAGLLAAQVRLQQAWELSAADRFLRAVLARVQDWRGSEHPDVAKVLGELALCTIGLGDRAKAEKILEQSLALDDSPESLIHGAYCYGRLGDSERAMELGEKALVALRSFPAGTEQGRRQWRLAEAFLLAGNLQKADELSKLAERQVPESEQPAVFCLMGKMEIFRGKYKAALRLYSENADRIADPHDRAIAFVQLAWLQARTGDFTSAKASLSEVDQSLLQLRPEHPIAYQATAVAAQVAFYSGSVYEGRELRQKVQNFLKSGNHGQSGRGLDILLLLEPFGREESQLELDVGTEILAATEYPGRQIATFPVIDASCVGLRHVARALHFSGQNELARDRLSQYESRYLRHLRPDNPLASSIHLTRATLAADDGEKVVCLEAAIPGLQALGARHVSLFPTLTKLTELSIRVGDLEKSRSHCQAALELRKSPRLLQWMVELDNGRLPELEERPSGESSSLPLPSQEPSVETSREPSVEPSGEPSVEPSAEPSVEPSDEARSSSGDMPSVGDDFNSERPTIQEEPPTSAIARPAALVTGGGAADLAQLRLARFLSERAEAPSQEEAEEFLNEVRARFGKEVEPNLEARLLLALLFPDGAPEASALWKEALDLVSDGDNVDLLTIENRARDANCWSLVVQTLKERLRRDSDRYGENAVETLESQLRLAKALESKGDLSEAYRRLTLAAEILRSWFGARSRRLLEPLAELIRVAEKLNDVQAAFEHQLERHRLLEASEGDAEELFQSRISLLPLRGRLGQVSELLKEAESCEKELLGFRSHAASEFVRVLLLSAQRVDQLHWRCDAASSLLEMALRVLPDNEISLGCRVRIALSECLFRKDYRSQAKRVRGEALQKANSLEAEVRAEMLHLAAQSCLRIQEVSEARSLAERILEERIPQVGRKDIWAGRAFLVLAEADLKTYRLEGTETAIGMSATSLQGTRFWGRAQSLKLSALFFLNRFDEAFRILPTLPPDRRLDLELQMSAWRGQVSELLQQMQSDESSLIYKRWEELERIPLGQAMMLLEFFARAGQVSLLERGLARVADRTSQVCLTDIRVAHLMILESCVKSWQGDWDAAASTLQRTIEVCPEDLIEFPDGLTRNVIREAMIGCFIKDGRSTSALLQAQQGVAEASELLGEEDIRTQGFRVLLAECARALGQTDDSLVILDEILTPLQDTLGDTHVMLRDVYRGLARTFLDQDDVESARMSAEEALRIDKEVRGLSIHFLYDLELLAEVESREDLAEAASVLETAVELAHEVLPSGHAFAATLESRRDELELPEEEPEEQPVPEAALVSSLEEEESLEEESAVGEDVSEQSGIAETDSAESLFAPVADTIEEEVSEAEESLEETVESVDTAPAPSSEEEQAEEVVDSPSSLFDFPVDEEEEVSEAIAVDSPSSLFDFSVDQEETESAEELAEAEDEEESAEELAEAEEEESAEELAEAEDEEESAEELAEAEDEEESAEELAEAEDEEESAEELAEAEEEDEAEAEAEEPAATTETHPRLYKASAHSLGAQPIVTSASIETSLDFPEVPLRPPHIPEPEEPEIAAALEEPSQEQEFSIEDFVEFSDPESFILPLAPVFFLPVPWKEATGAPFAERFEDIYSRFQAAFKKGEDWRGVVSEAVSTVRKDPCPDSGYFLFLIGAQLEKSGHLHTADVCLATSLELLEHGSTLGAACHLAGRVAGRRGELRRALDYFDRSAELAEEQELAVLKIDAAECHLGMGRPEEALLGFEEVFDYLAENAPKVQALAVQAKMAQIHLLIGDPDSSLALAEETKVNLSPKNAGTYRVLGRILLSRAYARLGQHELALELAEKAWEGAKPWSAKRKDGRRIAISNLVDIYCVVGRYESAQELVLESGLTDWGLAEAELLLRAGQVACTLGQFEKARCYVRLGKAFLGRFRSPALWRSCFLELESDICLGEGQHKKAQKLAKEALDMFEREATGPVDRSRHIVRAAKIAGACGDIEKARDLLEQAHSLRDLHLGAEHPHTSSVEGMTSVLSSANL